MRRPGLSAGLLRLRRRNPHAGEITYSATTLRSYGWLSTRCGTTDGISKLFTKSLSKLQTYLLSFRFQFCLDLVTWSHMALLKTLGLPRMVTQPLVPNYNMGSRKKHAYIPYSTLRCSKLSCVNRAVSSYLVVSE